MFNGNRSAGSSHLTEQSDNAGGGDQGTARDDEAGTNQTGNVSPTVEQPAGPNEPVEGQQQAERQEYNPYDARDIVAQEAMADASIAMAIAALLTFIVTGIGTFFLAWQVKLTREAVKDTGEAAEAMNEANRIAQNASRAWLTLDLAHGFFDVRRDSNDAMFFADLTVANIGKSPAGKITVHTCPVPDVMRNEIDDLRAISENLDGKFDSLTSFILLPGDKQTEQIIFSAPIDTFGWGKGTRPDILVVANYKLESGVIAQNSARFVFLEEGRSAVYCGEGFVQEAPLKVERLYNVRVT